MLLSLYLPFFILSVQNVTLLIPLSLHINLRVVSNCILLAVDIACHCFTSVIVTCSLQPLGIMSSFALWSYYHIFSSVQTLRTPRGLATSVLVHWDYNFGTPKFLTLMTSLLSIQKMLVIMRSDLESPEGTLATVVKMTLEAKTEKYAATNHFSTLK